MDPPSAFHADQLHEELIANQWHAESCKLRVRYRIPPKIANSKYFQKQSTSLKPMSLSH
jgi:hypothetical protein